MDDWRSEYENSSVDPNEGGIGILEYEIDDGENNSRTLDDRDDNYPTIDDTAIEVIDDETDQNNQADGDEINLLESLQLPNNHPPFFHEVEIETVDSDKRKITEVNAISTKIQKLCSDKPLGELREGSRSESVPSDVIVSSSTSKSDESGSGSLQNPNEEDKYFALAVVGILQRISPQQKAFAKVNILRYLTELEYGMETSIK